MSKNRVLTNPKEYLERIKLGDTTARDEFIMKCLPRIKNLVDNLEFPSKLREDAIQVGMLSVLETLESYDYSSSYPISILMFQKTMENLTKYIISIMPTSGYNNVSRLTATQMRSILNGSKNTLPTTVNTKNEYLILDSESYKDNYSAEEISLEDIALDNIELEELLSILTPRKKFVLINYFGLFGFKKRTTKEIARILNISTVCVDDHRKQALRTIKKAYLTLYPKTDWQTPPEESLYP